MNKVDEPVPPSAGEPLSGQAGEKNGGIHRSTGKPPVARSNIRMWKIAMAAGLAAGVIGGAIAEATLVPSFGGAARPYDYAHKNEEDAKAAQILASAAARGQGNSVIDSPAAVASLRNAVYSYGTLGAALGLCLGLAGGFINRSLLRGVLAGATGLVLGGLTGVVMARLLAPVYYQHLSADDLTYSLIVHGGIWMAVGALAGLVFGQGMGGWGRTLRAMVGGAGAAFLAAAIYEFTGGILFPRAMTNRPVSVIWQTRVAAQLLVTLLVSAGVVLAAESEPRHDDT
jgi:hypothetical protein